jgi:ABC-type polysaccharide/polyol phosphate export permease
LNPFYHPIEIVRAPILGHTPDLSNWLVVVALAIFGWLGASCSSAAFASACHIS